MRPVGLLGVLLAGCAGPVARPPNVLLVSLDTVRADHTTPYGYARDTTPVLARLGEEGTVFGNAFAEGNESAYSHAALFTGRYASELASPVYATYGVPEGATLVSEALRASGYATAMFSAGGHVTAEFGFDQGWDHYSAQPGFASLYDTGPEALKWIDGASPEKPWFVFLHTYDAHRPYSRPGPWDHLYAEGAGSPLAEAICRNPCLSEMVLRDVLLPELIPAWFTHTGGAEIMATEIYGRLSTASPDAIRVPLTPADRAHVVAHYDGALRYADTLLGETLATLQRAGELDNTVVIVLSDHGEDLLDHGYMNHRTGLTDSCTKVPLVAWGPGFARGGRVDGLVDGRDVAATILAVTGTMPPAGSGGRDLRAVARGESATDAVFAEGVMDMVTVRTATHRLVYRDAPLESADYVATLGAEPLDGPRFALYDLAADPGETTDVHLGDLATTAALRDRLVAWRGGLRVADYTLPQDAVSPATAAALREHGYWSTTEGSADPTPAAAAPAAAAPASTTPASATPDPAPGPTGTARRGDAVCRDRLLFLDERPP